MSSPAADPVEQMRCPDLSNVKKGDHFTFIANYVVVDTNRTNVCVRPVCDMVTGANTTLIDNIVFKRACWPATQHTRTKKVTRTELASILLTRTAGRTFEARFKKKKGRSDLVKSIKLARQRAIDAGDSTSYTATNRAGHIEEGLRALAEEIKEARNATERNAIIDDYLINGEERIMVARSLNTTTEQGRVNVVDMQVVAKDGSEDNAKRQIDPRTIDRLVLGGIEYIVGK